MEEAIGKRTLVQFTQNRSVLISCTEKPAVFYVRLHEIFREASLEIWTAVASFVAGKREGAQKIDQYIEQHQDQLARAEPPTRLLPHGETHDLERLFFRLNQTFFQGQIEARVTWSSAPTKRRRRSIRLGSYCSDHKIIRIHPALDRPFVPEYVVEAVLYHEMLHQVHQIKTDSHGRRCVHSKSFKKDEARFPHYEKACRWEQQNLARLLRA